MKIRYPVCAASLFLIIPTSVAHAAVTMGPVELDDTFVRIEINDTDGDAGLHLFFDGEAWNSMTVTGPGGIVATDIELDGSLAVQGLTELFSESSEPSFDEQPLEVFLALFPAGTYHFEGLTVEGATIEGEAELTHILPEAPVMLSPPEDTPVPIDAVNIVWAPVPDPVGSKIDKYELVLELSEEPLRVLTLDLPPDAMSVAIPGVLLEHDTEYKYEVVVREASGNQVITESSFMTAAEGSVSCVGDIDGDGVVGVQDLLIVLNAWGNCF